MVNKFYRGGAKLSGENRSLLAKEQFIATVSHDLKTPISAIKMAVDVLKQKGNTGEIIEIIERNADKAEELINHLLDAHLIKAGSFLTIRRKNCELGQILNHCIKTMAPQYRARILLSIETEMYGMWDALALDRAFKNLICNGLKFGKELVKVAAWKQDGSAFVSVHNRGEPIPPNDLPYLFNEHYRAPNSKGVRGWGLGLTIVRGIVEVHGGTVRAISNVTDGTTFTISLPMTVTETIV